MTDQEALDIVRAVLTGTTDPRTVTNVRPALQRLAALVAGTGEVTRLWAAVKLHRDHAALGPIEAAAADLDTALDHLEGLNSHPKGTN